MQFGTHFLGIQPRFGWLQDRNFMVELCYRLKTLISQQTENIAVPERKEEEPFKVFEVAPP